jgi:hypothetical protein
MIRARLLISEPLPAHPTTKLLKAAAIADLYGFLDFALEILERAGGEGRGVRLPQ